MVSLLDTLRRNNMNRKRKKQLAESLVKARKARWKKTPKAERSEIARNLAKKRWEKYREKLSTV